MEIVATVCPAGFVEKHPELHHYTSIAGLEGILASRTLWATHFQELNDSSEVIHLQKPLTSAITQFAIPSVRQILRENRQLAAGVMASGGIERYALMLRLYDTPVGVATRTQRDAPMPSITGISPALA